MAARTPIKAWASQNNVHPDVVRKIHEAVKAAKKGGLGGGDTTDYVEHKLGRQLQGGEFSVARLAKDHIGHDPPGGYSGARNDAPAVKEMAARRALIDREKGEKAMDQYMKGVHIRNRIEDAIRASKRSWGQVTTVEETQMKEAADIWDVAGDMFEEAGMKIRAGTCHHRALLVRSGKLQEAANYNI